jgi:Signal peptide peptidase
MFSNHSSKPALMTNILALSFAYNALCLLKLDSFQTGTILLAGLFVYDIWWVFGTEVVSTLCCYLYFIGSIERVDGQSSHHIGCSYKNPMAQIK